MYPRKPDKHKGKEVSHPTDLEAKEAQEWTLDPGEIADLGISVEEYEQDQRARQRLGLTGALFDSYPASSSSSTGIPSAFENLGISLRDYDEDRRAREALGQKQALAVANFPRLPPSSRRARPSRMTNVSINTPGLLTALNKRLSDRSTMRVRVDKDPFGVLESCEKDNEQQLEPAVAFTVDRSEEAQRVDRSLRQEALAGSEQAVPRAEDLPPPYDEGPVSWYQVLIRPVSRVPPGCTDYGYSHLRHHEGGPKEEIKHMLWDTLAHLGVDMELVQDLEDRGGYCFPMLSSRKPPFQTAGWQRMVELQRLNEEWNDVWETITPKGFEESQLVKEAKARAYERPVDSEAAS